jgi:LysR family glycine cleavage system transcriptional activator
VSQKLPSLSALRTFEVAGRLESFTKAADELNVTQGAVSRQVRTLEDQLGIKLFRRLSRRVELTSLGRTYLSDIKAVFGRIEQATTRVRSKTARNVLTIGVLPSFGSFWLMPKLAGFSSLHPDIDTRVISSIRPVDLQGGEADVAIRVGQLPGRRYDPNQPRIDLEMTANWRGVFVDQLAEDRLVPVYSPKLLPARITIARALKEAPLIHMASRPNAWPDWLKANSLKAVMDSRKFEYGHFFMSLEAARERLGIALVPQILLSKIRHQDLVAPFPATIASAGEYYLLMLSARSEEPKILAFRRWVLEQMAARQPANRR